MAVLGKLYFIGAVTILACLCLETKEAECLTMVSSSVTKQKNIGTNFAVQSATVSSSLLDNKNQVQHPSRSRGLSDAAQWHRKRRLEMMNKYGDQIRDLERNESSQQLGIPLLALGNTVLLAFSILSGSLPLWQVLALSIFPGSIFSLWQLQILHDNLHGSLLDKHSFSLFGIPKRKLQNALLFWGSLPCVFGYYLYLKFGHLTHHNHVGDSESASLKQLFASSQPNFEDGDVLFVAHRMKLKGEIGPTLSLPFGKNVTMSISKSGFRQWRLGRTVGNSIAFWCSFLFERYMLMMNDVVVSLTGRNYFFPNKPPRFHKECTQFARAATLLRFSLWKFCGWKSILFLFLSETLWSLPPHPAAAMFVTNHGSPLSEDGQSCVPSSSTYAGKWYSMLTLGTNYHCEHHDFPTIPFDQLYKLHQIAPEYYPKGSRNVFEIMKRAFRQPDWYACMDVGLGKKTRSE